MSLLEQNGFSRAGESSLLAARLQAERGPVPQRARDPHAELKTKIHRTCIARLGSAFLNLEGSDELARRVREIVTEELNAEEAPLSPGDRADLERQIADDILGYGPLEPFLQDPSVTEVMVNGSDQVYVERAGRIEETQTSFLDDAHLLRIIDRIVSQVGRRIDEASPMVDARLPDGSRVNAIIPPLALHGPSLTIRKFAREALTLEHLVGLGTLTEQTAEFLAECVRGKLNILISGGTGTGKTTLLNAVSAHVPPAERIVTVEDAAELRLLQRHVVSLESRPPNVEGEGEIRIRDLVRNALRMRPDRIIVGEVRGAESLDMLQAMNTGHDGSLTTVHANSARDALHRLEMLVLMAGVELPVKAIREQIAGGFDLLVHIGRLVDGSRRVTQITEISGMEGDVVTLQDLFVARAPEAQRLRAARAAAHDRPSARLPVQAQRQRRRVVALGVAGCRVRKLSSPRSHSARSCFRRPRRGPLGRPADPPGRRRPVPARAGDGGGARGQPPDPCRGRPPGRVRQGPGARRRPGDGARGRQLGVDGRSPAARREAGRDSVPVAPARRRRRRSRRVRARSSIADSAQCTAVRRGARAETPLRRTRRRAPPSTTR